MILALAVVALAGPGHNHIEASFTVYGLGNGCPGSGISIKMDDECKQIGPLGNNYFKLKSCTVRVKCVNVTACC